MLGRLRLVSFRNSEKCLFFYNTVSHDGKNISNRCKIDFNDSRTAFAAKSSSELFRALFVFKFCTFNFLVNNNKQILHCLNNILGNRLFEFVMRKTVYGHFVAGSNEDEIKDMIRLNRSYGVKSILDYSVEKDITESEAIKIAKDTMETVLDQKTLAPSALDVKYQTSLDFANRSEHVTGARTYFFTSEEQCDKNMRIIKSCIDVSANTTPEGEGFTAVKLTALGPPQLLMHISDMLIQLEKIFSTFSSTGKMYENTVSLQFDLKSLKERLEELKIEMNYDEQLKWFTLLDVNEHSTVDLFGWLNLKNFEHNLANIFRVKDPVTGKQKQLIKPLSEEGLLSMRNMLQRLDEIVQHAESKKVRVMIDAEQTYFQPAIRRITLELMKRYNKQTAIVFNTYQCYLKNAYDQISKDLSFAEKENILFGAKLVRGAYLDQERERAHARNYEDPINENYEETTKMYYKCFDEVIHSMMKRCRKSVYVMVASHNCDTIKHAIKILDEHNITPDERLVCFGQLLGMCDRISFSLGSSGYSVYKYMPYGPVLEVLPYLSRRALENKSVLQTSNDEIKMLWTELKRRITSRN